MKLGEFGCRPRVAFTVVETAIVLVVLGIIVAMGFPRFAAQARHQRIDNAATVVAADLELASSLAAARRQPVELRFDPTSASYSLVVRDSSSTLLRRSLRVESDFRLSGLRPSIGIVQFLPAGTLSASLVITLGGSDYHRTVSITRAGLVRVRP